MSTAWDQLLERARDALSPVVGAERADEAISRWVEQAGGRPLDRDKVLSIARAMQGARGHWRVVGRSLEHVIGR